MHVAILMLLAVPTVDVSVVTPKQACAELATQVQTGTLLVSQGDCLAVKIYSASRYTHVATVVVNDEQIYCYDSTSGVGVRKQTLAEYVDSQKSASIYPFHPGRSFSPKQKEALSRHLEDQLGRPYAISHHLTGARVKGLHCSEYATDGLIACGVLVAQEPSRVSPASLVAGIGKGNLYCQTDTLQLAPEPIPRDETDGLCWRLWLETRDCTIFCYRQMLAWFCCK